MTDTELAVVELATGRLSPTLPINEQPHLVTKCLNNGRPVDSSIGYMTRGDLFLIDALWLPDSSGFLTVNSYLGDGAQGSGSTCIFDYSRLRHYTVSSSQ